MRNNILVPLIIFFTMTACKEEVNLPPQPLSKYIQLYMPQAVNGPVTCNLSTGDTALPMIVYGADYGGAGYPDKDIPVTFSVDASLVDTFNLLHNTNYSLLPSKSYKLSDLNAVIKKGELATEPLRISVTVKGDSAPDISRAYILPITIIKSPVNVNENLRTAYFIFNIIPTFFDRSNWNIIDVSSQESVGEGPNNGRAIFALDGNINTFWHSQWKDGQPGPPHYFTIDMGETKDMLGAGFIGRQNVNSGRPQDIQLFVSEDNIDWKLAYAGTLANTGDLQKVFFSASIKGRYVKLQINDAYSSDLTHLAEFYLF
jgi:LysM repeat protein